MCGISGSGKTHHANRLAEEGYIRLSVDTLIWEKMASNLSDIPTEEKKRVFDECRQEILIQLKENLERGRKVVVDATHCKRVARDAIRNVCEQAGVKPVFLYCYADEEELWRRLSQRQGNGPDDLIVTRQELSEYYRGFERPQPDETDFIDA